MTVLSASHLDVPYHVLDRKWDFGGDAASENMVIRGDNLLALKALLPRFAGKVKCIYIDPPYNTGNEGWCYNDNVNDPQICKWLDVGGQRRVLYAFLFRRNSSQTKNEKL